MKLGQTVIRTPLTFTDFDLKARKPIIRPMRGTVVYLHPCRRFCVLEFASPLGPIRESFSEVD